MEENIIRDEMPEEETGVVALTKESRVKKVLGKVKVIAGKIGARNIVTVCSLLLIGTAVILNFVLFGNSQPVVSDGDLLGSGITDSENESASNEKEDAYFASAQLSRKQARDQALAVLQSVVDSESANAESKEQASADISRIASEIEAEANIETLIRSKGFEDCVVYIENGNAHVAVKAASLEQAQTLQILQIVTSQSDVQADSVNITAVE